MKQIIALIILIFPFTIFGQECDCKSNFEWAQKTFEENDAGFQQTIDSKGKESYKLHNEMFLSKTEKINKLGECQKIINEWLHFFRKGHLGFELINHNNTKKVQDSDWLSIELNLNEFKRKIALNNSDDLEGIWQTDSYTIALVKNKDSHQGIILNSQNKQWKNNFVKFIINNDLSGIYYMGDFSEYSFERAELLGNTLLKLGSITFKRTFPFYDEYNVDLARYIKFINATEPLIEKVDAQTNVLRIPSFDLSQKAKIDSIIKVNFGDITSSRNLIIDLRGNGGGAGKSYNEILPIIYTNPIKTIYWEHLSTELNNERWLEWSNNPDTSENRRNELKSIFKKLDENLGQFVYIYDNEGYDYFELDNVYDDPKSVLVLVDSFCASATEQFILSAKQSTKVKIVGTLTYGALDMSEVNRVESPDGNFELYYCLTKSFRLPDYPIDGIGIQPDYYIDKEIPKYEWIKFATTMLSE